MSTGNHLVAGIDSSTQSVKVVIRDASTGRLIRSGKSSHPSGTEVDPAHWWTALQEAINLAGGIDDVSAIGIGGQQHGMVALNSQGEVIRPALLWNDLRSAQSANDLNEEIGGKSVMAAAVGSALVSSFTASKVRWMADHEPENAEKVAAIALPHDWLSWKLTGSSDLNDLFTDRGEASGTGYFDPTTSEYRRDILAKAIRNDKYIILPKIVKPNEFGGKTSSNIPISAGTGDNAAAGLGVGAVTGDVVVSLGTSGTAFAVSSTPTNDPSGNVCGFASACGHFLPLVCTINATRVLDCAVKILGCTYDELADLALSAPPGSEGLTLLPYLEGERTPNRPNATGVFDGMTPSNLTRSNIARAMIEGMLSGLVDAVDSLEKLGVDVKRIILVGGGSRNKAVPIIASALFGKTILLPPPEGEYVADGAAKQAAWALLKSENPPVWDLNEGGEGINSITSTPTPDVMTKYRKLRDKTAVW